MQHDLHYRQSIQTGSHIVDHDPSSLRELFELTNRWRLNDIESTKKYKAQQQRFPRHRDGNQSDELAGDFVDHDELRVFQAAGSGYLRGRRDSGHNYTAQPPEARQWCATAIRSMSSSSTSIGTGR